MEDDPESDDVCDVSQRTPIADGREDSETTLKTSHSTEMKSERNECS